MATDMAEAMAAQAQASPIFDNSSVWHNFTIWTAQHLGYAVNMSKLAPSIEDLVWAGPRMVMKLGKLGSFMSLPDAVDGFGQRIIPESTAAGMVHATTTGSFAALIADTTAAVLPPVGADEDPNALVTRLSLEGVRGLGNVFSYATSKWALCCVAMAVVLNRTLIFAATRRRLRLRWPVRLLLRLLPIILFVLQGRTLLQSIQCQTSPDFAEMRWGNASKSSELMFSQANTFLHGLSSTLLFGATDEESCISVSMVPPDIQEPKPELRGSLSRLWPLFGTFCLSHFVETISCAVQGRPVAAETGMTLFEQSLAFAEADSTIGSQLGWSRFANASAPTAKASQGNSIALTRSMIMKRVNTSPEVLLIGFLSGMNHITSHILGILNLQSRFRLISTGFWGLCFMASIIWSAISFSVDDASAHGLLRYPAVCIVGFIPHVLVLTGIIVCCFIYLLALVLSALGTPEIPGEDQQLSFLERLAVAHGNMQANVPLSDIRIRMDMDFYTALLRAGFGAITMASEAVYLNEDSGVNIKRYTWLEDERFRELEETRMQFFGPGSSDYASTIGLVPVKDGQTGATSGYSRERVAQKAPKSGGGNRRIRDGVGAAERSGRWLMALEYVMHINRLLLAVWAIALSKFLTFVGVQTRPRWLRWLSQRSKAETAGDRRSAGTEQGPNAELMTGQDVSGTIPRSDRVDVEAEVRQWFGRRNMGVGGPSGRRRVDEEEIDATLYGWWLKGGWWGSADSSGDYEPPTHQDDDGADDPDFDATSVVSTTEFEDDQSTWESDPEEQSDDDGQRTPTRQSPNPFAAPRSRTPAFVDSPLAMSDLARLLHPTSPEERDEARTLAAHLDSDRILTRSTYQRVRQRQRAQVLAAPGLDLRGPAEMTPEDEAAALEQILLSRRRGTATAADGSASTSSSSWMGGAAGLGSEGPQCVVCQSSPRSVILWPCRCLCLCDDCRVSLAMNNFDKCVCCRREVVSFSRIYVP
ncbi:putative ubiquitin-protein ligase [Phialemonium atrogriseum]|uniref:Ubiquitin-protein ligase n=1 Tax=Phialemonium atrogriseum TaxID=1093897 RepID=A0AAJ0C371_9PEZI|nr:putative ubiquitin-protein ligase [Phialemonium atrogriseum]KAK1766776.1 putative ubiquitin-protein ligase [Phialemonium atrogriseum]